MLEPAARGGQAGEAAAGTGRRAFHFVQTSPGPSYIIVQLMPDGQALSAQGMKHPEFVSGVGPLTAYVRQRAGG